jgi:hypothetical protein
MYQFCVAKLTNEFDDGRKFPITRWLSIEWYKTPRSSQCTICSTRPCIPPKVHSEQRLFSSMMITSIGNDTKSVPSIRQFLYHFLFTCHIITCRHFQSYIERNSNDEHKTYKNIPFPCNYIESELERLEWLELLAEEDVREVSYFEWFRQEMKSPEIEPNIWKIIET